MKINPANQIIVASRNYQLRSVQKKEQQGVDIKTNTEKIKKVTMMTSFAAALLGVVAYLNFGKKFNKNINPISLNGIRNFSKKTESIIKIGVENVENIVRKHNINDYDSSKVFKINLHIHSTESDGKLHPLEILNQALQCAQKLPENEKFVFSVTDHDSIDGVRQIAKEIEKNPKKYSKLEFVPGIELSTIHHNKSLSKKPVELDFLIYGFDVEDKEIINEVARRKNYLLDKTLALFEDINKKYPNMRLTKQDIINSQNKTVKNLCSNGYLKALRDWLEEYLGEDLDKNFLLNKIKVHFKDESFAYDANISFENAVLLAKRMNAFSSIAHPGKFNFGNAELIENSTEKLVEDIFVTFLKNGGNAVEYNYMSYNPKKSWWPKVEGILKDLKALYDKTGGYDTHGGNIGAKL